MNQQSTTQCYDAVIVGAGQILEPDRHYMTSLMAANPDMRIIAADGGVDILRSWGYTPHIIVGDFDSIQQCDTSQHHPGAVNNNALSDVPTITLPAHKDETDMHEALALAWQEGARRIAFLGALGNRLDHTLANIQLLSDLAAHGGNGTLLQGATAVTVITQSSLTFPIWRADAGHMVSVFAHSDVADKVILQGLAYEGTVTLNNTHAHGVSNEFVHGKSATITAGTGLVTVTWSLDCVAPSSTSDADQYEQMLHEIHNLITPYWDSSITADPHAFGPIDTTISRYYTAGCHARI